jgi:hypothetical protein
MNRRTALQSLAASALLPLVADAFAQNPDITPETVYELRIYHLNPGKLPLILERFRTKETKIFARLGMHNVAFWTPTMDDTNTEPGGQTLIYLLRHKSVAAARDSWKRFSADPEWVALKAETEKDGAFVDKHESTFMHLTDFSPAL